MAESMWQHTHQCSHQQCYVSVKALWVQWVHIWDHNSQSRPTPFMLQLDQILGLMDPGEACHLVSSTGRLLEPAPQ